MQPIIAPLPKALLSQEIASLNTKDRYIERGKFEVYITQAHKIPTILKEIGRLRETTFREVGEGTGNSIDIDIPSLNNMVFQVFISIVYFTLKNQPTIF